MKRFPHSNTQRLLVIMASLSIAISTLLTGCSNVGSGASLPTVITSSPAQDSIKVSILSSVTVTLNKSINAESVNSTTVKLTSGDETVRGTVSYDAETNTITFEPGWLSYGETYILTLDGVTTPFGKPIFIEAVRFATYVNPVMNSVSYNRNIDGTINSYRVEEFDEQGVPIRSTTYSNAGDDGEWETSDDVVSSAYGYEREINDDGNLVERQIHYVTQGADGQWFTDDDQSDQVNEYWLETTGDEQKYYNITYDAGADFLWQTEDDSVERYSLALRTTLSHEQGSDIIEKSVDYSGPGFDGLWFTSDDEVSRYFVSNYEQRLNSGTGYEFLYIGAGDDGVWFTGDDDVLNAYYQSMDNQGSLTISYENAGADSIWKTEDDTVSYYRENKTLVQEQDQSTMTSASYDSAGEDGLWFTADDEADSFAKQIVDNRDPNHRRTEQIDYVDSGIDCQLFTDDDMIGMVNINTYDKDDQGEVYLNIAYQGSGDDGQWLTDDDEIGRYRKSVKDAEGNRVHSIEASDSGVDGVWFTDDDVLDRLVEYDTSY